MKTRLYLAVVMLFTVAAPPSLRAQSWLINGNGNTTVATNFLGTTNNQSVAFRTNNVERMRLTNKGEVYVIEANPNPWLSGAAEFAIAAKHSGRSYTDLIGEIVELAQSRYLLS